MKLLPVTGVWLFPARDSAATHVVELGLVGLVAAAFVLLWFGLGAYSLLDNNEGVYASVASDMLQRMDWVTPHLNGVPYQEKPPLYYYLLTASFALFGANEWSARAVSALAASCCLMSVYWAANALAGRGVARLAALMLLSCIGFVMLARTAMPDMLLIACFSSALMLSFVAWRRQSSALLAASLVTLAAATLAKGLLAPFLFMLIWLLHAGLSWRTDGRNIVRFLAQPLPWLAFLIVAAPWHIAAMLRDPDFAWFYFVNEHVMRFFGQRIPVDTYSGSALYYLPRILLLFFPWVVLLPSAVKVKPAVENVDLDRFAWIASAVIVGFFTLASSKANYYVALALPTAALWLALRIKAQLQRDDGLSRWETLSLAVLTALVLAAGVWAVSLEVRWEMVLKRWRWDALYLSIMLVIGISATALCVRHARVSRWHWPVLATALVLALAFAVVNLLEPKVSARRLVDLTTTKCRGCTLMLFRDYESISAVGFSAGQAVTPVIDSESNDLWWGQVKAPQASAFVTSADVLQRAAAGERIAVVVPRHERKHFLDSALGKLSTPLYRRGGVSTFRIDADDLDVDVEIPLP